MVNKEIALFDAIRNGDNSAALKILAKNSSLINKKPVSNSKTSSNNDNSQYSSKS
jgi:hypothetical protein